MMNSPAVSFSKQVHYPDINCAAQDLCDAAEALVTDTSAKAHQEGRLRLLCEMHLRFYTGSWRSR